MAVLIRFHALRTLAELQAPTWVRSEPMSQIALSELLPMLRQILDRCKEQTATQHSIRGLRDILCGEVWGRPR